MTALLLRHSIRPKLFNCQINSAGHTVI